MIVNCFKVQGVGWVSLEVNVFLGRVIMFDIDLIFQFVKNEMYELWDDILG